MGVLAGKSGFGAIILLLVKPSVVGFGAKIFSPGSKWGVRWIVAIPESVGFDR